jgi:hypothetical protein
MTESNQTPGDPRVIAAREFLVSARKRKVIDLPPSVLTREDAELRRLLGQVLDYIDESGAVPPGAVSFGGWDSTVRQAFRDAIRWHTASPSVASADQVALYRSVGRKLGIEVDL